ncbi:unnamed protein product [Amoebophrya sp. A25]|nr:unnamed protein product [Amoebophrya sp. A25]CAD7976040.1 unnamed protein product [Amoebophrya sp. A25]|eukprot:GSA25T00026879001.1
MKAFQGEMPDFSKEEDNVVTHEDRNLVQRLMGRLPALSRRMLWEFAKACHTQYALKNSQKANYVRKEALNATKLKKDANPTWRAMESVNRVALLAFLLQCNEGEVDGAKDNHFAEFVHWLGYEPDKALPTNQKKMLSLRELATRVETACVTRGVSPEMRRTALFNIMDGVSLPPMKSMATVLEEAKTSENKTGVQASSSASSSISKHAAELSAAVAAERAKKSQEALALMDKATSVEKDAEPDCIVLANPPMPQAAGHGFYNPAGLMPQAANNTMLPMMHMGAMNPALMMNNMGGMGMTGGMGPGSPTASSTESQAAQMQNYMIQLQQQQNATRMQQQAMMSQMGANLGAMSPLGSMAMPQPNTTSNAAFQAAGSQLAAPTTAGSPAMGGHHVPAPMAMPPADTSLRSRAAAAAGSKNADRERTDRRSTVAAIADFDAAAALFAQIDDAPEEKGAAAIMTKEESDNLFDEAMASLGLERQE